MYQYIQQSSMPLTVDHCAFELRAFVVVEGR